MRSLKILVLVVFALFAQPNEGHRILCIFPYNGRSHFIMFDALCKGLARKGHQIDMISHFPSKKPIANFTDVVDLRETKNWMVNTISIEYGKTIDRVKTFLLATAYGNNLCEIMGHERMQKFIQNPPNDPPYDLVITEYFGSSCYFGFGSFLKVPVVAAVPQLEMPHMDNSLGNPFNYAFFAATYTDEVVVNTFFDRFWNAFSNYMNMRLFYYYSSEQTEITRKYLSQDLPDIRQLENSVSLALVNTHHSLTGLRPITPNLVEVGGLHIESDESKLTPELETWLDLANEGVVYFTLGSLINVETLPKNTLLDIYASFAKISPMKVLMKCTNTTKLPYGLPSNVIVSPWIPQIAVLRHKNIRAFITHGGMMGTQEAIYHGVPMIGIPVFSDQTKNMNILVHKNIAVLMNIDNITEKTIDAALNAVLYDPKYREAAKRASRMYRDRPMSPLNTAIYWVEYILKYGPDALRSPSADMPWWKLYLIDVFAFSLGCILFCAYLLIVVLKFVFRRLQGRVTLREKKLK